MRLVRSCLLVSCLTSFSFRMTIAIAPNGARLYSALAD
jgi:hypothetical protein